MRHPFITTQLLRQARTAASIERNRPAPGAGPGRRVPRLLVWGGVTLLIALAALGVLLPAGTALGAMADERGQQAAQEQVTTENATQQELAKRWTYYYHATQMSPAELKAWLQAKDRADTSTEPPAQAPTLAPPAQPSGQPGWLVASLGVLAAAMALVAGLALMAAGAPTAGPGSGQRPNNGHALRWAVAPTRQPHRLAGDRLVAYLARTRGNASGLVRADM